MKRIHPMTLISVLLVAVTPLTGQQSQPVNNPFLDNAEVRLPYAELRKLWEAAQEANKPEAPEKLPDGALLSARYTVDVSTGSAAVEAEFKVESFAGKWERLPLMGAGLAVAGVEPADARLVIVQDSLCLLAKEAGQSTVKVRFVPQSLPQSADQPFVEFTPAPSAVASLEVKGVPEGKLLKLREGTTLASRNPAGAIALPTKGAVALYLTEAKLEPKAEPPPPPPQPSEWALQNEVLVWEGEGEICHHVQVHAMALNGSALEATVLLPGNARSVKLEDADDLADWKLVRNGNGLIEVRVHWKTRDLMERDFKLSYAVQQLPLAPTWELRAPIVAADGKTKSLFMVVVPPGVEFTGPGFQPSMLAAKLSKWVGTKTKNPELGTLMGAGSVILQSRLLPRTETAVAIISKSEYTTRLVGDGSALTEASLEISHDDSLRWTFTLPEKGELLRCTLNDTAIRPVAREAGVMEIPLVHMGGKVTHSKIAFSWTTAKGKLDAVEGQAALELPLTPLFIQEILWSVEVPESYEISATEGNLENAPGSTKASAVRLIKKLCRNERPQTQLFYRKRGLE